jgi:hypothetical protein
MWLKLKPLDLMFGSTMDLSDPSVCVSLGLPEKAIPHFLTPLFRGLDKAIPHLMSLLDGLYGEMPPHRIKRLSVRPVAHELFPMGLNWSPLEWGNGLVVTLSNGI